MIVYHYILLSLIFSVSQLNSDPKAIIIKRLYKIQTSYSKLLTISPLHFDLIHSILLHFSSFMLTCSSLEIFSACGIKFNVKKVKNYINNVNLF